MRARDSIFKKLSEQLIGEHELEEGKWIGDGMAGTLSEYHQLGYAAICMQVHSEIAILRGYKYWIGYAV